MTDVMFHKDGPYLGLGGHQGTWVEDEFGKVGSLGSERPAKVTNRPTRVKEEK